MDKITVGITGGIGAGKSVVSRLLRCNGFEVYDCDSEAKRLMTRDTKVKQALIDHLGQDIYLPDGNIDKGKLAKMLFTDFKVRNFVNKIVHQAVRDDIRLKRNVIEGLFFIESAIIVTGGIAEMCDQIWIVTAPLEERIDRVMKRDGSDLESIQKRIETQEKELSLLKNRYILEIENDNHTPILLLILKLTNYINNYQTYEISC